MVNIYYHLFRSVPLRINPINIFKKKPIHLIVGLVSYLPRELLFPFNILAKSTRPAKKASSYFTNLYGQKAVINEFTSWRVEYFPRNI